MGNQPMPGGSPLSVTAAAPDPQIDASTVALRITRRIFDAGSWPHFSRLSALSPLAFGGVGDGGRGAGEGGKPSVLSMGMLPGNVYMHIFRLSRAEWGLTWEAVCLDLFVWRLEGLPAIASDLCLQAAAGSPS